MESVGDFEYSKKDLIGHGAFAVVFRGRRKQRSEETVAIKCINKKNLSKSQTLPEKEIEILKDLHHENVVSLLHFKETSTSMFLVMEYCNGGDLADYLHVKGTLSEDTIRFFLRQIAAAMMVLHSKGIIHRDLKPQNLLLSHQSKKTPPPSDIRIKIADFGFARILEEDMMAATLCGSPLYMAPEVIMSLQYDGKADLWSLGTIIFQCLTGSAPFKASNPQELKKYYQRAKHVLPDIPQGTSKELKDLLIRLLKRNQKDRIEFDAFFSHPFLGKKSQPTSSAPMPVPSRTRSFLADSPEQRTLSVSPLSGNMPISSPEDQPPRKHRSSSSQSDNSRGGAVSSSPDKYGTGTPQSINSLDNEIVEGDFVLVSPHFQCTGFEQSPKSRRLDRQRSVSDPPQDPRRSSLPSPPTPVAMFTTQAPGACSPTNGSQSPNERPTSLPIATGSSGRSSLSPSRHHPPGIKTTPPASTPSPHSAISPSRTSPQGVHQLQFGKLPSPVAAVGLTSPSSLPSSGSPGGGVIHRISSRPQASPSPPLFRFPTGSSNSPPQIEAGATAHHKWSPPTMKHPGSGSPARRKLSSPARISPLAFNNPTALPTIMGSPTKRGDKVSSPMRTEDIILEGPLSAPFARPQRTKTFSGAIAGYDGEDCSPRETALFPRSASSSRLDQYSLKAAFESLGKSPAGSIEGLAAALATSPPTSAKFYIGSTSRRNSALMSEGSPNSQSSITYAASPPNMMGPIMFVAPELPEETLLEPEHNETVERLTTILHIVDAIIEVAQQRSDPLAESIYGGDIDIGTGEQVCFVSEGYRRAEQVVLYARGLELLSAALEMAKTEILAQRLKPSNAVRNVVTALNDRYHQCLGRCRSLYDRNMSRARDVERDRSLITADKLMYNYAVELCQSTGLDELFGNPQECASRYHTAQWLLHGLCLQATSDNDRELLLKYKLLLDQRILHLEKQPSPALASLATS
ncbi:serine/threonine-protein kinase unc-51-like [Patiria miniata]|uniref:non-specific serine/threonine protein kinase n=1 Tax=Patiria miniata TaxID=46514 RepID=A0A914A6U6_PATMI|nr:serine/threonine-protein kinase unc-51-like [Patiria miniata]